MILLHLCSECAAPDPGLLFSENGRGVADLLCERCASEAIAGAERQRRPYQLAALVEELSADRPVTARVALVPTWWQARGRPGRGDLDVTTTERP